MSYAQNRLWRLCTGVTNESQHSRGVYSVTRATWPADADRAAGHVAVLGAECHESNVERLGCRNCSRPLLLTSQVGDIPLKILKLCSFSVLSSILEPRRRIDHRLYFDDH